MPFTNNKAWGNYLDSAHSPVHFEIYFANCFRDRTNVCAVLSGAELDSSILSLFMSMDTAQRATDKAIELYAGFCTSKQQRLLSC